MSDDEEEVQSEEEEEESDDEDRRKKESEAEKALKKRREQQLHETKGLDETAKELLELNRQERDRMEDEINELRRRNERRKKEREVEEKRLAAERAAEDERRKAAEESKRRQKLEDEERRQRERAMKKAEFEKWKNPPKPNFVISKRSGSADEELEEEEEKVEGKGRKSKEQLEAEKRAILKQRIKPLEVDGFDAAKLSEKAKELHAMIYRLEGEKYDLEKRFKAQQIDMMELAERARQANKVGKGGLKRLQPGPDDNVDKIQERFAGAPAKIEMYSKYERQKDKRSYDERLTLYTGPQYVYPPERIKPTKIVGWNEEGLPMYREHEAGQNSAPVAADRHGEE
jgi:troponin T